MKVLVDTNIWADHFRSTEQALIELLRQDSVIMHPFVLGELAMGNLRARARTVASLEALPPAPIAPPRALLDFVADRQLGGTGLGLIDAHLLLSASLSGAKIWTRDRRLDERAEALSLRWLA